MALKKHYEIDNNRRLVKAIIVSLTEREKKEIKNYIDLGYNLVPLEKEKKPKLTEEEKQKQKKENPFSEQNIQAFLKKNASEEQQKEYWKLYNTQGKDSKTGLPLVYKTDSKENSRVKFKKGDPRPKGHIATLQWFKKTFPEYNK